MEEPNKKRYKIFHRQPILCPWIASQPYHSSVWFQNRANNHSPPGNFVHNNPWGEKHHNTFSSGALDKSASSIQQSSSQFFFFLRLMQLFPDTHPATLHSVLTLCRNDFYCAVDKLLYAKRCKLLCYKKSFLMQNKLPQQRIKASESKQIKYGSNNNNRQPLRIKSQNGSLNLCNKNNEEKVAKEHGITDFEMKNAMEINASDFQQPTLPSTETISEDTFLEKAVEESAEDLSSMKCDPTLSNLVCK